MSLDQKIFIRHFKHIPIGVTGIGLGMGGLGNLYAAILSQTTLDICLCSIIQIICSIITIIFLILILLRNLAHQNTFSNEIRHPLLSSFLPTICMSSMIVAGFFGVIGNLIYGGDMGNIDTSTTIINQNIFSAIIFKGIGSIIWYIAVVFHIMFFILFMYHVFLKHDTKTNNLFASWFVPPVGIIVACTVVGYFNGLNWIPNIVAQIVWYFGFVMYMILLPYIIFKLFIHKDIKRTTLPSFAIFGAPANLSLVGFYTVFNNVEYYPQLFKTIIIGFLTILGICTTITVYVLLFWIFRIKFNPTYASLTFPLAIGSTAVFKSFQYFKSINANEGLYKTLEYLSYIETAFATIIICYVLIRMIFLIFNKISESEGKKNIKTN